MKILIYDVMQNSDADAALKSPALADDYTLSSTTLTITFDDFYEIDCIGIGNTDIESVSFSYTSGVLGNILDNNDADILDNNDEPIQGKLSSVNNATINFGENGLYEFGFTIVVKTITFTFSSTGTIGRLALGKCREICTIPAKEPGYYTTEQSRITLSGQVIAGAGGYSGRKIGVDVRYKITEEVYNDFDLAHAGQIAKLFPFFIDFDTESYKLLFSKFYGGLDNGMLTFQNSIRRFLYSKRFDFIERF